MAIIDLRGSNDELFRNIGQIVGGLANRPSEEDKARKFLFENPERAAQLTDMTHRFIKEHGAEDLQGAINLQQAAAGKLGDANVDSRTATTSNAIPGQGEIPVEVLQELIDTSPESRESRLQRMIDGKFSVEDEADALILDIETRYAANSLEKWQAENELEVLRYTVAHGLTPKRMGRLRAAQVALEEHGQRLDAEGLAYIDEKLESASPHEREMLQLGLAGPRGATLFQDIQQHERLSVQEAMTRFAAANRPGMTELEREVELFDFKNSVREAQADIIERMQAAVEGDRSLLPGLIGEFRDNNDTLMRIDSAQTVQTVQEIVGWFRGLKDVDFGVADLIDFSDQSTAGIEFSAALLAQTAGSEADYETALADIRAQLSAGSLSGRVPETYVKAIQDRAEQMLTEDPAVTQQRNTQAAQEASLDNPQSAAARAEEMERLRGLTIRGEGEGNTPFAGTAEDRNRLVYLELVDMYSTFKAAVTSREGHDVTRGNRPSDVIRARGGN